MYRTALGSILSILIATLTISFAISQLKLLSSFGGTNFTSSIDEEGIGSRYEFTYDTEEFAISFMISDVRTADFNDPLGRPIEEFFDIEAGIVHNDYGNITRIKLESHPCTDEDMNKFFPINEKWKWIERLFYKVHEPACFDMDEVKLLGG